MRSCENQGRAQVRACNGMGQRLPQISSNRWSRPQLKR